MKTFTALLLCVIGLFAESWALMVAVGAIHGSWLPDLPTLAYGAALRVNLGISLLVIVVAFLRGMVKAVTES